MKTIRMVYLMAAIVSCVLVFSGLRLPAQPMSQPMSQPTSPPTAEQKKALLERVAHKGEVIEAMDSSVYTYVQFREKDQILWVAARQFKVKKGDTIEFSQAAPMKNFHSKTLDKTFATILFVGSIKVNGKAPNRDKAPGPGMAPGHGKVPAPVDISKLPKGHAPIGNKPVPSAKNTVAVAQGSVKKAAGGYTVSQCYAGKEALNGKQVKIRGRVVKFTPRIMGKNWLHIKDGSGKAGSDDLTVTSQQEVKIGDLILVTGTIVYDKNFGSGYLYKVIIEKATLVVE